ncbi:hypothetical protein WP8W19C02_P10790 (plasmid) [Enterobacter cloacae]|nr:hypothetical protein WP8W19C02_P10790 [Enterobacter cloacae]
MKAKRSPVTLQVQTIPAQNGKQGNRQTYVNESSAVAPFQKSRSLRAPLSYVL